MLRQRHFLTTKTFALATDGVDVTERGVTWSRAYRVPFGHIPSHPERISVSSGWWLGAVAVFTLFTVYAGIAALRGSGADGAIVWLVWGGLTVVAGVMYAASRRQFVIFRSGEPGLVLFDARPSVAALEQFIEEMHQRRVACFAHQAAGGANVPEDLGERLRWLQAAGLLSEAEVQTLLREFAGRDDYSSQRIQ